MNAKRREQFERIKAEVAPDLSVHLLDGMGREAMVASDAALTGVGYGSPGVYAGEMPDGGGISHEAFYLLVGEAAGEN
ncbi:lipid-A-disaccharide synthase [Escherichia coli]|uniref:Lipid-A-disaccharide synthase n=1 Tax=Escherichia coli TaxID=562 RepID=A0A377F928_ECOLX|nr:lipid-A-disaccharide synthase [Escherichia coli]